MILDSSAIVAVIMKEPGFDVILELLSSEQSSAVGTATLTETAIVLSARLRHDARSLLSRFLSEASIALIPFGESHYSMAVEAWLRYGKGRHPAGLNFGDCLAYATAKLADQPLLFVGNDFQETDIQIAWDSDGNIGLRSISS